ncbi:MAG: hypothetical protein WD876_03770 [Candidatus Pacearchaeota archaeon]
MKQIILDTSFIITCVKQKIDFFEEISNEGMRILIPSQVIAELKGLGAETALKLLEKNDFDMVKISGKETDNSIITYAKKHPDVFVATLDKEIKDGFKGRVMIIRGKKKLEVI